MDDRATLPTGFEVVVLTMNRDASLRRLLASLARANSHGDDVDLYINIDTPNEPDRRHHAVRAVAKNFHWPHGDKVVTLRQQHLGLADSWFQAVQENAHPFEFVAIFEGDMEVHAEFYTLFSLARRRGAMKRDTTSAFCLTPDDWEVRVQDRCDPAYSQVFYESPEPCNWGPIWKSQEWFNYVEFVAAMRARGEQPIVPRNIAYNYNTYLSMDLDVQSPWVWRYNWERSKRHVRYHAGCLSERRPVVFLHGEEPSRAGYAFQDDVRSEAIGCVLEGRRRPFMAPIIVRTRVHAAAFRTLRTVRDAADTRRKIEID